MTPHPEFKLSTGDEPAERGTSPAPFKELVDPARAASKAALKTLLRNGALLLGVLWVVVMWLFGSNYGASERVHNLKVLVCDFDGGAIGAALLEATQDANGRPTAPTFVFSDCETHSDASKAVWKGEYWAAITSNVNSTTDLDGVIDGTSSSPPTDAYTWYAASARYPNALEGYLEPAILEVLGRARELARTYAVGAASGRPLSASQVAAVATPASSRFVDAGPMTFQARIFANAFGVMIATLIQFAFNLPLSAAFTATGAYRTTKLPSLVKRKYAIKLLWTLLTALSFTSFYTIYNNTQRPHARAFFAACSLEWVFAWINFNTMGIILAFVPPPFVIMALLPVIVTSVAAALLPIELSNIFYRISYIYPSHAYWNVAITIYGSGVVNRLYIYLPVLAMWIVITETGWVVGIWRISRRLLEKTETV